MKRILGIVLAAVMILSCSMTVFAEVTVEGGIKIESEDDTEVWKPESGKDAGGNVSVTNGDKLKFIGDLDGINRKGWDRTVYADNNGSTVEVTGDVEGTDTGVYAIDGASVNVGGSVKKTDGSWGFFIAIKALLDSKVNVEGDVTSNAMGIQANNSEVTVKGSVTGNINVDDSRVIIGTDAAHGIFARGRSEVIVEGTADSIMTGKRADVYIGQAKETKQEDKGNIHYLIGTADGSNDKINVIGEIVSTETIDGVKNNGYYFTTTADSDALSGKSFVISSTDSNKKIKVKGTYDGVSIVNNLNGTVTLIVGENFKGGIQAMMVIFEDIVRNSSGSSKPINTGTTGNPVTNGKWTQNADGTWSYATTYKFTNDWAYIAKPGEEGAAAWYYFDRNGNMLTGWQQIMYNGGLKWFYFIETKGADEGKCLMNATTPDGHKVGADGAWIED